jgi:hypothetical protein
MLLRALTYRDKDMETLLTRAVAVVAMASSTCWITLNHAHQETEIINKLGPACPGFGQADPARRQVQVRGLDGQGHAPHQRQEHHGRDDAGRRQGLERSPSKPTARRAEAMDALLA